MNWIRKSHKSGLWIDLPFAHEESDGSQESHDADHGGKVASTGFHIHDTHFHVLLLQEKPSRWGNASENNDGKKLGKITWVKYEHMILNIKVLPECRLACRQWAFGGKWGGRLLHWPWPLQRPLGHSPPGPSWGVPQENRPRKRLNKLTVAARLLLRLRLSLLLSRIDSRGCF